MSDLMRNPSGCIFKSYSYLAKQLFCVFFFFFASNTFACTAYAPNHIYLGEFETDADRMAAMTEAVGEFWYCSCGGSWQGGGKNWEEIDDCRFEADSLAYNYGKFVEIKASSPQSNTCTQFKSKNGRCENFDSPEKISGGEEGGVMCGNPIDLSNGVKVQYETDYSFGSNSLLEYTRVYSSVEGKWIFPFETKITRIKYVNPLYVDKPIVNAQGVITGYEPIDLSVSANDYISITRPNGSIYLQSRFSSKGDAYDKQASVSGKTEANSTNGWSFSDKLKKESYDADGRLVKIESPTGKVNITYPSNTVTVFTDNYGNALTKTRLSGDNFKVSDNAGFEIYYTFSNGKLTNVSYSDGSSVTYHYENAGLLTGITDEEGKRYATWNYDSSKRGILSKHANNAERINLVYNANNTVSETSISGKQAIFHFEKSGNRNRIVRIQGMPTSSCLAADSYYSYDDNGFRKTFTDKNGNVTETLRNNRGWVTTERTGLHWVNGVNSTLVETDSSQKTVTSWHNDLELPLVRTYYGWNGSSYVAYKKEETTYTGNNRIATFTVTDLTTLSMPIFTYGRTHVWIYSYSYYDVDQTRLQQQTIDGPRTDVNDITTYNYDASGNLSSITNALNHATTFSGYNTRGLVGVITDVNNNDTNLTYTLRGWLNTLTVNNLTTDYDYYANGLLQKVTLPDGSWLAYTYNDARHLTKVQNNLGESINYTPSLLDGKWTQEAVKDANANIIRQRNRVFDELGRVMTLQGQHGQIWQYGYDKNDNLVNENDALQQVTTYQYDAQNRISETLDAEQNAKTVPADKHAIKYAYDIQGNIKTVTDQRGNSTYYIYDGFGELLLQYSPDTGLALFTYDQAGNLLSKIDEREITNHYTYDALNRLLTVTYNSQPQADVTYSYDNVAAGNKGVGRMTAYSDKTGSTEFIYGTFGISSKTFCDVSMHCYISSYSYDANTGHLSGYTYPSGNSLIYSYDTLGRVSQVGFQEGSSGAPLQNLISAIVYHPFGGISHVTYGNGMQLAINNDSDGRVSSIQLDTAQPILSHLYGYDAVNQITAISDTLNTANSRSYEYDKLSRLTETNKGTGPTATVNYQYDEVGNRTVRHATDVNNNVIINELLSYEVASNQLLMLTELVSGNVNMFTYDAVGNIRAQNPDLNNDYTYQYGDENRMIMVARNGQPQVNYEYNALGQRIIKKPVNGTATYTEYGLAGERLAEHDLYTGQYLVEYVYLNGQLLARLDNPFSNQVQNASDADNDGFTYQQEIQCGSLPNDASSIPQDSDADGRCDALDAFANDNTETDDFDGDAIGNNADTDDDNDSVLDIYDAFVFNATESADLDGDGIGDNADIDRDNDGVADAIDDYPDDATEWYDLDGDGIGNNADGDIDDDGLFNGIDPFVYETDTDWDGWNDVIDLDDDNDGVYDTLDAFPLDPTETLDTDGDGTGNNADTNDDNDGYLDANDACPLDMGDWIDTDGDSYCDNNEIQLGLDPNQHEAAWLVGRLFN